MLVCCVETQRTTCSKLDLMTRIPQLRRHQPKPEKNRVVQAQAKAAELKVTDITGESWGARFHAGPCAAAARMCAPQQLAQPHGRPFRDDHHYFTSTSSRNQAPPVGVLKHASLDLQLAPQVCHMSKSCQGKQPLLRRSTCRSCAS